MVRKSFVYEAEGARSGGAAVEIARIVLDTGAVAELLDHLQVVVDALAQAVGLQFLTLVAEAAALFAQVEGDLVDGRCRAFLAGHEDVGRVYVEALYLRQYHARMRVDGLYLLHLVAPEHNPQLYFLEREHDVNRVAAHAETSRQQIAVAAGVASPRAGAGRRCG